MPADNKSFRLFRLIIAVVRNFSHLYSHDHAIYIICHFSTLFYVITCNAGLLELVYEKNVFEFAIWEKRFVG